MNLDKMVFSAVPPPYMNSVGKLLVTCRVTTELHN